MMGTSHSELVTEPLVSGCLPGIASGIQAANEMVGEIAPTNIPILIVGESGTGKDVYARLIHRLSLNKERRFCKINCASFDPLHFSSQLNEFKQLTLDSPKETLYLDNVQELDAAAQRVLLSFLSDQHEPDSSDDSSVRIISSSCSALDVEVEADHFRRELYFRLNGACLRLPSLRDRIEDIPAFAEYFLNKYSRAFGKQAPLLTGEAIHTLSACRWPGNIRQLENLIRKMVVLGDAQIALNDLDISPAAKYAPAAATPSTSLKTAARAASEKAERELILQALERTHWNRKRAARELQISYKSLLYKIKQIGVSNGKNGN